MKFISLFTIILTICFSACNSSKKATMHYYVEPFKEQEIKLYLKKDSTFSFQDNTGCNQFEFIGNYKKAKDSFSSYYFLFDSVKLQFINSKSNHNRIFQLQDIDTAWIVNKERIFIHNKPFTVSKKTKINLQKIRYKKVEEFYTNLLGRKGFLKIMGDGSRRKAKKNLFDCRLPDLDVNIINKDE